MTNMALYIWYKFVGAIFRLFPINTRLIVVSNFFGKGYGDSPKYVVEEMFEQNKGYKIVWLVKKYDHNMPDKVRQVKRGTFSELYYLSTARVWIDNSRKHAGITKRKGQFYVQTWHGGIALKKIEGDSKEALTTNYIRSAKSDSEMIDVLLSNSKYFSKVFKKSFWYRGEIKETGMPRSDIFFGSNNDIKVRVSGFYGLQSNQRIAVYVPTFRDDHGGDVYNLEYTKILDALERRFGGDWVILVRMHPNASEYQSKVKYSSKVLDGAKYSDVNELIVASDLVITDYSSCMFDGMLAKKRVILYTPDAEEYLSSRGMYFSLMELPFPHGKNNEELRKIIQMYDDDGMWEAYRKFEELVGLVDDGDASKRVVNLINDQIGEVK